MAASPGPSGESGGDLGAAQLGIEPIPERHRVLGFLDYFVLWADFGVGLLVLLAGTLLVPGLGFWPAMAAIVLGTLAGVLLLGLAGVVGSDLAIPSMVGLRPSFGVRGSYLPSLVNVIQLVGFGAFEVIIMAQASARLAAPILGAGTYPAWAVAWGAVAILMGLGGPLVVVRQWLEKAGVSSCDLNRSSEHGGRRQAFCVAAVARSMRSARSRPLPVMAAARRNSTPASSMRPSFARRSPRTLGSRW